MYAPGPAWTRKPLALQMAAQRPTPTNLNRRKDAVFFLKLIDQMSTKLGAVPTLLDASPVKPKPPRAVTTVG